MFLQNQKSINVEKLIPKYCVWELTLACNLRCGHCGTKAGTKRPDEMTTEECLSFVKQFAELGGQLITLSGGEPTLRKDWYTIAKSVYDSGVLVNMVTNGYDLNKQTAKMMKNAGLANVAISIDGTKEVHDKIRGKGSYDKCIDSLSILSNTGIKTAVMTTVNTLNINHLNEIHDLAVKNGAGKWRTQLGKSMGNMKVNDNLVIRPRQLLHLLPTIWQIKERSNIDVSIGDSIGYYSPYDIDLRAYSWDGRPQCWGGCQAGLQSIGVEANGGIKGCLSIQAHCGEKNDPYVEANLRDRSLKSIWYDPEKFAYNRKFSLDQLTGFCRSCTYKVKCRGGATCVATATLGTTTEDPYCYHRVAEMGARKHSLNIKKHIATAATVATFVIGGCDVTVNEKEKDEVKCEDISCSDDDLSNDILEECCDECINCDSDYGDQPSNNILNEGCENCDQDYGFTPSNNQNQNENLIHNEDNCSDCDYGSGLNDVNNLNSYNNFTCADVECSDPDSNLPEELIEECCMAQPEYGVEPMSCEDVNCSNPDSNLPEELIEECCTAQPDYGVEVTCEDVNCAESGLPEELIEECCTAQPDYGVEPAMMCEDVPKDILEECCEEPVDCSTVCCECDYGVEPTPEELAACCDRNSENNNSTENKCDDYSKDLLEECCESDNE